MQGRIFHIQGSTESQQSKKRAGYWWDIRSLKAFSPMWTKAEQFRLEWTGTWWKSWPTSDQIKSQAFNNAKLISVGSKCITQTQLPLASNGLTRWILLAKVPGANSSWRLEVGGWRLEVYYLLRSSSGVIPMNHISTDQNTLNMGKKKKKKKTLHLLLTLTSAIFQFHLSSISIICSR